MRPTKLRRAGWERVVIVASGPSFDDEQAGVIMRARAESSAFRVIVVNDNYQRVTNADLLFGADDRWWKQHMPRIRAAGFLGELWSRDDASAKKYGLRFIRESSRKGLTREEMLIHGGGNGGFMSMQLAYLFGATHEALVGFDMKPHPETGAQHWFGEHPGREDRSKFGLPFRSWIERMNEIAPQLASAGVSVVNCTRDTALTCFPRQSLEEALKQWTEESDANRNLQDSERSALP